VLSGYKNDDEGGHHSARKKAKVNEEEDVVKVLKEEEKVVAEEDAPSSTRRRSLRSTFRRDGDDALMKEASEEDGAADEIQNVQPNTSIQDIKSRLSSFRPRSTVSTRVGGMSKASSTTSTPATAPTISKYFQDTLHPSPPSLSSSLSSNKKNTRARVNQTDESSTKASKSKSGRTRTKQKTKKDEEEEEETSSVRTTRIGSQRADNKEREAEKAIEDDEKEEEEEEEEEAVPDVDDSGDDSEEDEKVERKKGGGLSKYEQERLENIRKNREMLASLMGSSPLLPITSVSSSDPGSTSITAAIFGTKQPQKKKKKPPSKRGSVIDNDSKVRVRKVLFYPTYNSK